MLGACHTVSVVGQSLQDAVGSNKFVIKFCLLSAMPIVANHSDTIPGLV